MDDDPAILWIPAQETVRRIARLCGCTLAVAIGSLIEALRSGRVSSRGWRDGPTTIEETETPTVIPRTDWMKAGEGDIDFRRGVLREPDRGLPWPGRRVPRYTDIEFSAADIMQEFETPEPPRKATAKNFSDFVKMLVRMRRNTKEPPPIKSILCTTAKQKYKLGPSQFRKAYECAEREAPNELWGRAGAPKGNRNAAKQSR